MNHAGTEPVAFHIAPQGDDQAPGALRQPFRSLKRARDAVRELRAKQNGLLPDGGVTVWLHGGRYELAETFALDGADSGQKGRPVVYQAVNGETPVLSGGRIIRGWEKVEGDLGGRLSVKGKVWAANVPEARDGAWPFRNLWRNGKPLPRASLSSGDQGPHFTVIHRMHPYPTRAMNADRRLYDEWRAKTWNEVAVSGLPAQWQSGGAWPAAVCAEPDLELFAQVVGGWTTMRVPIAKAEGNTLTCATPLGVLTWYWGQMSMMAAKVLSIENALWFLDTPGEWYLDRQAGVVYYLPEEGEDPNAGEFVAPKLETLVHLRGTLDAPVRHVEFRGLTLEHAGWTLPKIGYRPGLGGFYGHQITPLVWENDGPVCGRETPGSIRARDEYPEYCIQSAVDLTYAWDCRLEDCCVRRTGASGIGLAEGCRNNRVLGCEVCDTGAHGIHFGMPHGEVCAEDFAWLRPEDLPVANEVANCHVHHVGQMDRGSYGIFNSYCQKTRIAHNLVEQVPYCGIAGSFSWFVFPTGNDYEVTVEYNRVRYPLRVCHDGGGLYFKDRAATTSVVRGNYVTLDREDVKARGIIEGWEPRNGIYLDDGTSGLRLADNVVPDAPIIINTIRGATRNGFVWGTNYVDGTRPAELIHKAGPEAPYRSRFGYDAG